MDAKYEKYFPVLDKVSIFGPGRDNAYGTKANGGHDTNSGVHLDPSKPYSASPWRNELKRSADILDSIIEQYENGVENPVPEINPMYPVTSDITLHHHTGTGKYVVTTGVDVGGLDIKGKASSNVDFVTAPAKKLGMTPSADYSSLGNNTGILSVSLGSAASYGNISLERAKELKAKIDGALQKVDEKGRFLIHRPHEAASIRIGQKEANSFWNVVREVRDELYSPPDAAKLTEITKTVEKVNSGEAPVSELKKVMGTEFRPDLLQDKKLPETVMPAKDMLAHAKAKEGAAHNPYVYDPKTTYDTPEKIAAAASMGLEGRQPGESEDDFRRRKNNHISSMVANMDLTLDQMIMMLLSYFLFGEEFTNQLFGIVQEQTGGRGNYYPGNVPGRSGSSYNRGSDFGVMGGARRGTDYKLPPAEKGEDAADYYIRAALSFDNEREVGKNRGEFVDWLNGSAGSYMGAPYCSSFVSKIYEGTKLFSPTALSLNVGAQFMSTGSFRKGTSAMAEGLEKSDIVIIDRGAYSDLTASGKKTGSDHMSHIILVAEVFQDANGKVTGFKSVEGNASGKDAVSQKTYTIRGNTLLRNGKSTRLIGFADVSHRAEAMGLDLNQQLQERYHSDKGQLIADQKVGAEAQYASGEHFRTVINIGHNAWYKTDSGKVVRDSGASTADGSMNEVQAMRPIAQSAKAALVAKGTPADNVLILDMGNRAQMLQYLPKIGYTEAEIKSMDTGDKIVFPNKLGPKGECWARAKISEHFIGEKQGAFVRLDFDARGASRPGVEMFYRSNKSGVLADNMFGPTTAGEVVGSNGGDGKIKVNSSEWSKDYSTLKYQPNVPSVILEVGNGQNAADQAKIKNQAWREAFGQKLANGVLAHAQSLGLAPEQIKERADRKAEQEKVEAEAKAAEEKAAKEAAEGADNALDEAPEDKGASKTDLEKTTSELAKDNANPIEFGRKAASTGSFTEGEDLIDGLEKGDFVILGPQGKPKVSLSDEVAKDWQGHVIMVAEVQKNKDGKVTGFKSIEGKAPDSKQVSYTVKDGKVLKDELEMNYIGFADSSHRAEVVAEMKRYNEATSEAAVEENAKPKPKDEKQIKDVIDGSEDPVIEDVPVSETAPGALSADAAQKAKAAAKGLELKDNEDVHTPDEKIIAKADLDKAVEQAKSQPSIA